jgi:hypothetical protein
VASLMARFIRSTCPFVQGWYSGAEVAFVCRMAGQTSWNSSGALSHEAEKDGVC